MKFDISKTEKSGLVTFRLKGPFGASEVQDFRNAVHAYQSGYSVVLDLAGVTQIDGFALASLVRLHQRIVTEAKKRLVLIGVNPAVSRLLEVTAMARVFSIFTNEEEAVKCLT